ncbi:MAG: hypothetical protein JNL11_16980 [Bdellovibrionaceae bacterium]|nr:hypothetical protein [Pseudobdellovibrionaceae bacterium]
MNVKQNNDQKRSARELNLSLIQLEKAEPPSLWSRLKKSFSTPDLTKESWELLEMKRTRSSFSLQQWRDF